VEFKRPKLRRPEFHRPQIGEIIDASAAREIFNIRTHFATLRQLLKWNLMIAPVAIMAGLASALFLKALKWVTLFRFDHPWLLFLLPVAGICIAWLYYRFSPESEKGNNLVLAEIHSSGAGVSPKLTPLIFVCSLLTHLCGGSAGREGTGVQMGAGIAAGWGRLWGLDSKERKLILLAGVAAGFGSVFGTPLAGALFAMEVLVSGMLRYEALLPVVSASVIGWLTCGVFGIEHEAFHIRIIETHVGAEFTHLYLIKACVAGAIFGLAATFFAKIHLGIHKIFLRCVPGRYTRPFMGGLIIIALTYALGDQGPQYLGIGTMAPPTDFTSVTLERCFEAGIFTIPLFAWFWKTLFTAITLGSGFKGGEVLPLFFLGSSLGAVIAGPLGLPVDLCVGLGFVAVFAGATNTPLASTLLAVELFGGANVLYFAIACFTAYYCSSPRGIYASQIVSDNKLRDQ
jgi:H+/Cl- antiporter ClcA